MTLDQVLEDFHLAANAMARGDAELVKSLYSHADDATLANPFGHAVRGWENVSAALDFAASRFSDGEVTEFDLRVSSTYRNEAGEWKLVHRHADPISTFDADGPVRRTT